MNDQRITSLEQVVGSVQKDVGTIQKDVAVVQTTMDPLVVQMKASTKAMNELTTELSNLVVSNGFMQTAFDELKTITSINGERLKVLEGDKESKRSGDKMKGWAVRSVVSTLVPIVLLGVAYMVFGTDIKVK